MTGDRNRTTERRALRAAGIVAGVVLGLGLVVVMSVGIPLRAAIATAVVIGAFVGAAWLLLSMLLDTIAGDPPDRRRTWWTIALTALAMIGPFLLLSAFVDAERAAG